MLPTPMNPITTFSLGGTAPFEPNTEDGTMYGKAAAPNTVLQMFFKNCRRFMLLILSKGYGCIKNKFVYQIDKNIWNNPAGCAMISSGNNNTKIIRFGGKDINAK